MRIMVYDTECNGLDTKNGFVQELGFGVYEVDEILNGWRLLTSKSYIVNWGQHYIVEPDALETTELTHTFCEKNGTVVDEVFATFAGYADSVDFLAGQHVIPYDYPMMMTNLQRAMPDACAFFRNKPHIDSMFDMPVKGRERPKALKYWALDKGYVLSNAHQAISDVFACAHIMSTYRITEILEIAKTPLIKLSTQCAYGVNERKELLYKNGFRFNPSNKLYEKVCREFYWNSLEKAIGGLWHEETIFPEAPERTFGPQTSGQSPLSAPVTEEASGPQLELEAADVNELPF